MLRIDLGKYEVIENLRYGVFKALRYGEEWRNLVGDNLVLALVYRIEELAEENKELQRAAEFLDCLESQGVHNWMGYKGACELMRDKED